MLELTEAADLIKCEIARLEELLRSGELPGVKFGRSWVVPKEAFIARVNEIALAQSAERRAPKQPVPTTGRRRPRPILND